MKVTGHKRLMKQFKDLPVETHAALKKSLYNNAKYGARKAKQVVPVDLGELKAGINAQVYESPKGIFAFVNFNDGTQSDAIKVGAVNYGRKSARNSSQGRVKGSSAATGQTGGYGFIEYVKLLVGKRSANSVKRSINKAIKDAMNG
jgi:hypothetical protein